MMNAKAPYFPAWVRLLLAAVTLWQGVPALADTDLELLDLDLKAQRISLNSVQDGRMTYFDSDGLLQVQPLDRYLRFQLSTPKLAPGPGLDPIEDTWAVVDLVDGRRWTGKWLGADSGGQVIHLKHWLLGKVKADLEQVRQITFNGKPGRSVASKRDQVVLVNGDSLLGFVDAIKEGKLMFQPQGKAQALALDMGRVKTIQLANPARLERQWHTLTLTDGSRIHTRDLVVSKDRLTLTTALDTGTIDVAMKKVSRVDLANPVRQIIDLASLPMKTIKASDVFGLKMAPWIAGSDIHLHAPVAIQFTLPQEARRFSGLAQIDTGDRESQKETSPGALSKSASAGKVGWADFVVKVAIDQIPTASYHVHAGQPEVKMNFQVTGRTLTIELDSGRNGPVMDRLRITQAIVLLAVKPQVNR